jgi:hypothetical protein
VHALKQASRFAFLLSGFDLCIEPCMKIGLDHQRATKTKRQAVAEALHLPSLGFRAADPFAAAATVPNVRLPVAIRVIADQR